MTSAILILAAGLSLWRCRTASPRGPVIIFLVDTLRFDRMSAYGASRPTTPAAERLAQEGVRYDAAYATASWTRPSVASLFTSRYPAEVGAIDMAGSLDRNVPAMADLLQRRGWRTAGFCGNGSIFGTGLGFRKGFQVFEEMASLHDPDLGSATADRIVGPAAAWVDRQSDGRFLLYIHLMDPHAGRSVPGESNYRDWLPGYENLFSAGIRRDLDSRDWRLSQYDALVRQADDQFAVLRRHLERKGFWKSALVIYLADHGEEFYEHGGLFHGHTLYEELLRVPLIAKGPGWGRPGHVVKAPTSLLDILPSVAHWTGLAEDSRWRGKAIDQRDAEPDRALYFSEDFVDWRLYGLKQGPRKMIVSLNPPYRVQFDLGRDPGEQRPVSNEQVLTDLLERYRRRESTWFGGLAIRKIDQEAFTLEGGLELSDDLVPYLSLEDYSRFPIDPRNRRFVPIHLAIGAGESFESHFVPIRELAPIRPRLRLTAADRTFTIGSDDLGRAGPVEVRYGAMTRLSAKDLAENVKDLRRLGYLGGGN